MSSIHFLDDSDLVEQDRDEIRRILQLSNGFYYNEDEQHNSMTLTAQDKVSVVQ